MDIPYTGRYAVNLTLYINGHNITLQELSHTAQEVTFTLNEKTYHFRSQKLPGGNFLLEYEHSPGVWQRMPGASSHHKNGKRIQLGNAEALITEKTKSISSGQAENALSPCAPMPGLIRDILVKKGENVSKGQALIVMEAMKLQTTLYAGGEGTVEAIHVHVGDLVTESAELIKIALVKTP